MMEDFYISPELAQHFSDDSATVFDKVFHLEGEDYRLVKARRTFRFEIEGRGFFAKVHHGIGWKEIFKELFQFKLPVLGAGNEYAAIRRLEEIGVPTMTCAAYGKRGKNPARQESFLVTEELKNMISLEDFVSDRRFAPLRRKIFDVLADELGKIHRSGVNHRDCYICHFMLDPELCCAGNVKLHVIDLHRACIRKKVPYHYLVKDVAGILFSSFDLMPSKRELLRFIRIYSAKHLKAEFAGTFKFWNDVVKTAAKLYKKEFGKTPDISISSPSIQR